MALQLGALRDALIDAGANPSKADAAAAEAATYDNRLGSIETRLAVHTVMFTGLYALVVPAIYLLIKIALHTGSIG